MSEEGLIDNEIAKLTVHEYMKNLHDVDALVLGCTHYPLFVELFKNELRTDAEVINTGTVIANQLQNLLGENLREKYEIEAVKFEININVKKV